MSEEQAQEHMSKDTLINKLIHTKDNTANSSAAWGHYLGAPVILHIKVFSQMLGAARGYISCY